MGSREHGDEPSGSIKSNEFPRPVQSVVASRTGCFSESVHAP
jgi:hypothetical protein